MKAKHLVSVDDLTLQDIEEIFVTAEKLKSRLRQGSRETMLAGKTLGMIFEKPSARTRVSFEVAMTQLGGHAIYLRREDIRLGERESAKDIARVFSHYLDAIMARTYSHEVIEELAHYSTIPVINGLSDYCHPCQCLSDLFTIREIRDNLEDLKLVFVGDGNNVARSLASLCARLGVRCVITSPEGYELPQEFIDECRMKRASGRDLIQQVRDPKEAASHADVLYTDVWTSMGQDEEVEARKKAFKNYRIDEELLSCAKRDAVVMHCLPAHRGEEITDRVLDGPKSIVFEQAENRLHVQKALLKLLVVG